MPRPGDIDTTYEHKLLAIGLRLCDPFCGAKVKHKLCCLTCKHTWSATPISKLQSNKKYGGNGCPNCSSKKKDTVLDAKRLAAKQSILDKGFEILSNYDGKQSTTEKIRVRNIKCGHVFESASGNLLHNNVQCPVCNTERKRSAFREWGKDRQLEYLATATQWQKYKSAVYAATRQSYKQHKHFINPANVLFGRAGVEGAYHLDHIVSVRYCFDNLIPVDLCAHPQNLQLLPWEANLAQKDKLKKIVPPIFYKLIDPATVEKDFVNQVTSIMPGQVESFSDVLSPYTATVYVASLRLCIFFRTIRGSLEQTTRNRKELMELIDVATKRHINYVIVYEDEWFLHRSIVLSKLSHLSNSSMSPVVYARHCVIKEVTDTKIKSSFLANNHLQGNDKAQITLGAYFENQLMGVMTFAKPRVALGSKAEDGVWELSRFATDNKFRVPGIAGKLLAYFKKLHKWTNIYSYADRRWSTGKLYQTLGFIETVVNSPEYYYIRDGIRMHRWNYRKDILKNMLPNFDASKTEYQNMLDHGYDRVWGAGTIRYDMHNVDL